ncbi:glycosyltransferase family 4 protein [Methylacidiphilum kamchatkense]|uniref:Glycosyltransferase involved in cell wall biosynthesis n=1 Tax=Methylacidiphilum kamchatkense Kam1 TaxID=1202785 RepID=A0A516TLN7_9BACT|nr:glycosyltransferase family 4 protein [Methylacidiphilum kamchatkense]QDQ42160.1 glycosyltransferase involved in cell wall biosynthesis [Methylacidiphilum kamchatkense Kam1]
MRIAQVSPLYERVPPKLYGGTERVIHYLTEELITLGHETTLFASGDSITKGKLVSVIPESLRLQKHKKDPMVYHILMLEKVFQMAESFDIIHYHIDFFHFPFSKRSKTKHLTTLHGRLDLPDLTVLYREFDRIPVVSISKAQRSFLPWIHWVGTVYHGIPADLYPFYPEKGNYLAFVGRISPEKGIERAIEIAKRVGMDLKIAAKVDEVDKQYFLEVILPLFKKAPVEFIGEIGEEEKKVFLGNASALLFPVNWPEPFGLVMIEAMACGTPVIGWRNGSVPEIVVDGQTGYIIHSVNEGVKKIMDIDRIDRKECRKHVLNHFTARKMAQSYLSIYNNLLYGE